VATAPAPTRRARLREALKTDIKGCAARQLAEGGPAAVSLRGIAREVGVSPAALYGYFDSLDDLFTALITDGYDALADAVAEAVDGQPDAAPGERMLAGIRAFRTWALSDPATFRLLYFNPVPGFEPQPEGPTMAASLRVFVPLLALLVDGWTTGALPPPPPGPAVDTAKFEQYFGLAITSDQLRLATECWAEFHGLVALEINGHIADDWVDPDALYEANIQSTVRRMGWKI
jgi:AcrR family transcriptional regulator